MKEDGHTRIPTPAEAVIPVASLILLVSLSYHLFGEASMTGPSQVALIVGIGAIFILFAVGALIGTWAMSGTLVAMVYYGLQVLNPDFFYATAALMCAVISSSIGTSWTTVGTVGIGLMGVSQSMGLDPSITAAAVISGAYFGDTTSPLSDTANLAAGMGGSDLYSHLRETALPSGLALAISVAAFWAMGAPGQFDPAQTMSKIEGAFIVSPWLFLPLLLVVILAYCKLPPFTAIFSGALAGGLLAVIAAPERVIAFGGGADNLHSAVALLKGVWLALASGYKSTTGIAPLDELASRGGMASMLNTIWLVISALAFGGVIERTGVLERIIRPVIEAAKSATALVATLVGAVFATNVVAGDQYIALVLPSRMFKSAFAARGLDPVVASRTVAATATPTSALIPWNSCGAYMTATLGVSTLAYAPYAIFNYTIPLISILLACAGVRMIPVSAKNGLNAEK